MSQQQRDAVDARLRSAPPRPADVHRERVTFAERITRPLPADTAVTDVVLGGRPALDLRRPGTPDRPVLLYLHGGGYSIGSARTGAFLADALARRAGVRAVSLDYRLAPEDPFPAAVEDVVAAYRDLLEHGHDPGAVAVAGDSAGGGLAVAALVAARQAGLPMPAAVVALSPWVDLTLSGPSIEDKAGADPIFTRAALDPYVRRYLGDRDRADVLASPVRADLRGLPALLVQVGSHEVLLDDAVALARRAGLDDVDVTLEVGAGLPHVYPNFAGMLDEADAALERAGRFLAGRLAVPAAA